MNLILHVPTCCKHKTTMKNIGLYCFLTMNGNIKENYVYEGNVIGFTYLPCNSECRVELFSIGELNDNSTYSLSN